MDKDMKDFIKYKKLKGDFRANRSLDGMNSELSNEISGIKRKLKNRKWR